MPHALLTHTVLILIAGILAIASDPKTSGSDGLKQASGTDSGSVPRVDRVAGSGVESIPAAGEEGEESQE